MNAHAVPNADRPVLATVAVPGSKSLSNRALVCAALADGESEITELAPGDDTVAMVECLGRLGIEVEAGECLALVRGTGGRLRRGPITLPARLAGTTSRFVTALAALGAGPYTIDGEPPLRSRPMGPLHDALTALGADVTAGERPGHLPVTVSGPPTGHRVTIRGDVSSQYVTALMLIAPLLADGLVIDVAGHLVSRPYVEITAAVMRDFGVPDVVVGEHQVRVPRATYEPTRYAVEPDASSASYPLALAALVGGTVTVPGLTPVSQQGDARFAELLAEMGCQVIATEADTTVTRDPTSSLLGIDVDMADVSDLVPTLAVVAVLATSSTRIRGVGFIRGKESDRLGDLAGELTKLGARVTVTDDGLDIEPIAAEQLRGARLVTHHDHRLAMAFGVLGAAVPGVEVDDPGVVSKSWPGFWDDLAAALRGAP
ncbi:3-phosphoshikimate 1-carboxyvinyltransferase [soil metagenome]